MCIRDSPNILVTSVFGVFGNQFTVDPVTRTAPPPTLDAKYSVAWNTTTGMCPGNETVTGVSPDGFGDPLQITVPSINYTTHKCFVSVLEFELPNDTFPDGIDVLETKILFQVDNSSNITYINPPNCDWMPIVNQPSATNDSNSVYRDINNGTAYLTNDTNCTLAGNQTVILGGDANQDLENNTGVNWFAVGIRPYNRTLNSSRSSTAIFSSDTASPIPPTVIPTLNVTYNQAPSVSNVSFPTNEDTDKNVTLSGNDTGGENLTFFINADSVGPCPGQLNITSTAATQVQATYHPCANFNGNETFQYHVQDNFNKTSNNATITFIVAAVNDAPVANNDSYSTNEDTNLTVNGVLANDTDVDGDNLTAILVSGPASGTLNLSSNGSFTYIPALNFNGVVNFTYKANDGLLNSSVVATVTITVISVNDAPNATIKKDNGNLSACVDDVAVPSNMTKLTSITLSGVCSSDIDGNITSYSWTATKGTLSNKTSPTPTYTAPSVTRNTDVTITLTVTDNNGATKTTSVIIKVLK